MVDFQIPMPIKKVIKNIITSPTVRVISGLAGGNLFAMGIGLIGSLIQARFVSPEDLGFFRQFSVASGYIFFLNLGIFESVQRLFPFYIGKNQKSRAIAVAEIGQSWNILVSILVSLVLILLAILSAISGDWRSTLGWLVQIVTIFTIIYGGYLRATYRSGHDFSTIAKSSVLSSLLNLVLLPLVVIQPYIGLVLRGSLGSLASLLYLNFHRPLHLNWRFNWTEWFGLIRQGFPTFIAGYISATGWSVTESAIILSYLGTKSLGLWTMTAMIVEMANKIPQAIVAVFVPRIMELYGKTESVASCMKLCRKPVVLGVLGTIVFAATGSSIIYFAVPVFIPKYVDAIPVISIALFIMPLMVLELPNSILIVQGMVVQQNMASILGLVCFVVFALVANNHEYQLIGIAIASLIGRILRLMLIYIFIFWNSNNQHCKYKEFSKSDRINK